MHKEQLAERNKTHGLSREHAATYKVWKDMRARCYNPNNSEYQNYGGRGIAVCDWWSSFANFYADMGDRPDGLTVERKDVDGHYEPANCTWATRSQQANNKRTTRKLTINGRTQSLSEWCRELGFSVSKASYRLRNGLDPFAAGDYRK